MGRTISYRGTSGSSSFRGLVLAAGLGIASIIGVAPTQAQQFCGGTTYPFPYTDVSGVSGPFCPGIMEAYVTGISKGTTPTTFSPNNDVPRLQMTTFLQRTVDQVLTRGSRRAALNQWWTPQGTKAMQTISLGEEPQFCAADGQDIWTSNFGTVLRVRANSGEHLNTYTDITDSEGILVAAGFVFIAQGTSPGGVYVQDPLGGPVGFFGGLGNQPTGIAFDGINVWTANQGGSVSIISLALDPVQTIATGFSKPRGILYDGANIWVTDEGANTLLKLDANGNILKTVTVGSSPYFPVFDGANIWVPNAGDNSITVVQASSGNVVATITGNTTNMLNSPAAASFDGERILITNQSGDSVTLFKAADLSFIANVPTGFSTVPYGACSDGINFWVMLNGAGSLLRF